MSWPASIFIGILSAAIGGVASGVVAGLCVGWYRISSFEGGSGYFVVFLALLGIVVGLICGITVSRIVAASAHPGALRAFGMSAGLLLGTASLVGSGARFFADVPPTIKGEALHLLVEVRWPASQKESPALDTTPRSLRLGSLAGHTMRKSERGPLWMRDARVEDGHWIVPGAVEIFTNRGTRVIDIEPAVPEAHGLLLPMNGTPGKKHLAWSEWMPRSRPGAAPLPDGYTFRYKVVPRNEAVRTETVGPFEVATIAGDFYEATLTGNRSVMGARAEFAIRHRGKPVTIGDAAARITEVAALPGTPAALLVRHEPSDASPSCVMLADQGDSVQSTVVSACAGSMQAMLLSNDPAAWSAALKREAVPGELNRATYTGGGTWLFDEAIFDMDHRAVRSFSGLNMPALHGSVGPLALSPDHLSFVRLGYGESDDNPPALVVIDADARKSYHVPIDLAATRYGGANAIGPEWLNHYFTWEHATGGHDQLTVRKGVAPLPFKGVTRFDSADYIEYQVAPAGKAMADVLAEFLRTEFHAERTPEDLASYSYQAHIGQVMVHVFNNESEHHVSVFVDRGGDASIVARIGEKFDAQLATGKHDALFEFNAAKQD